MEQEIERLRETERSLSDAIDDLVSAARRRTKYCPDIQDRIETAIAAIIDTRLEIESKKIRGK